MSFNRIAACILIAAMLAAFACTPAVKPESSPAPTAASSEEPSEGPTEGPIPAQAFPTPGMLGNLVGGGPVLPEGLEYFVIDGESDIRYLYDRFGSLVMMFNALSGFGPWSTVPGVYGEYGIPYGYCIKRGEMMPNNIVAFGNRLFEYEKIWDDEEGYSEFSEYIGFVFTAMWDEKLEKRIDLGPDRIRGLGPSGSILPVDGRIILISSKLREENDEQIIDSEATLLDENGNRIGELDAGPFGGLDKIAGVFGRKYLLVKAGEEKHPMEKGGGYAWYEKCHIYTLAGEPVMRDCWIYPRERFHYYDGLGGAHIYANCFVNRRGEVFDEAFEPLYTLPADTDLNETDITPSGKSSIFHSNYRCDHAVDQSGVYAGVKDANGNWLFRIYDPRMASDRLVPNVDAMPDWYWKRGAEDEYESGDE